MNLRYNKKKEHQEKERMSKLNTDFKFFESKLPELLKEHKGQFVLIKDQHIHGIYTSLEDALKNAYEKLGNSNFIIQEITDEQRMHYINASFITE